MGTERRPVVIDNGSGIVKAGFAGDDSPLCVFASVIGKPRSDELYKFILPTEPSEVYVGDDAQARRGRLMLTYPIANGIMNNECDMKLIWEYTFKKLNVDPTLQPVLLTEAPLNPKSNRRKMFQVMFEHFEVPKADVQIQAVLSLYSAGRVTGVVTDSGDGVTHTVPIYDGYSVTSGIRRLDLAGRDLTKYFADLVTDETGQIFRTSAEIEIIREMKEKLCYVAEDYEKETLSASKISKQYELPDGNIITTGASCFQCPEALFKPCLIDKEISGIHETLFNSINACDVDLRKELYSNIVLSGGTTMLSGLAERLDKELEILCPRSNVVKVHAPKDRQFSVWIGGSILSSLSTFQTEWITRESYFETGAAVVDRQMLPLPTVYGPPIQPKKLENWQSDASKTQTHYGAHKFEYLRRIFDVRQVDWEFAVVQMICLCVAPRKVYQFVDYRKQTKNTWSRDDPGVVILSILLIIGASMAYSTAFKIQFPGPFILATLFPVVLYVTTGITIASIGYLVARYHAQLDPIYHHGLTGHPTDNQTLEWTYCFDIHSNGTFPTFLLCTVIQFFMAPFLLKLIPRVISTFLSNSLYAIAGCYYCYIASLGYSQLPAISNAVLFLYPTVLIVIMAFLLALLNINLTDWYLWLFVGLFK